MSYKIDFGVWNSVFAVPSAVVDKGLRLAGESQLKVLLYILRNAGVDLSDQTVSDALGIHPYDVRDAISYWTDKGLFVSTSEIITIAENTPCVTESVTDTIESSVVHTVASEEKISPEKPRPVSRATKPEPGYVAKRLRADKNLVFLMDEAQRILGKVLSNSDTATLIMLHDTDGLPVEVILMLMEHCVQIDKGNMRYIERTGIKWAADGVTNISLAEEKIRRYSESSVAWVTVSAVFGIRLSGTPTKKQIEFADRWINEWGFTEEMLRLAYERCVDQKGEMNLPYINAILKRWFEQNLKNPEEVLKSESASKPSARKKNTGSTDSESASYDIDEYEKKSIFDD